LDAPTENGSYGNPQSTAFPDSLEMGDDFLSDYIGSMGFVIVDVNDGIITNMTRNEAAYQKYIDEHPPQPEPEPEPSEDDATEAMLIDHEYRITMIELGGM